MRKYLQERLALLALITMVLAAPATAFAVTKKEVATKKKISVESKGSYVNWDGVSNVNQFLDNHGELCFAYDGKSEVTIVKTSKGSPSGDTVVLKKKHPLFGGTACDKNGNFYLVTGEANEGNDTTKDTIFISKYDASGKHIKTIGDNGSSSLASYYGADFHTKFPFDGGNCDIAVNDPILAVNYARKMYSGHQSNSIFAINMDTMTKETLGNEYNSHSFAQRAIPFQNGFAFASEGDCYNRAFTITRTNPTATGMTSSDVFHFWVKPNALSNWDMLTLNNNFAHLGGIAALKDRIALVGTSAKSLNAKAAGQTEQLFIQIMDPSKNLNEAAAYFTTGKRSGLSGGNGDEKVTNYGVKWLTSYGSNAAIQNPQVVSDEKKNFVIFFEKYKDGKYLGVYYMVITKDGKILKKAARFSKNARLNPSRMPVYSNGTFYWVANRVNSDQLYIYSLKL